MSVGSRSSERKRGGRVMEGDSGDDGSSDRGSDGAPVPKVAVVGEKRGRGRPPTTGQYVGLARAKAELVAARRAEMELQAEQELAEEIRSRRSPRVPVTRLSESSVEECDGALATDLGKRVLECVATIEYVATKSGNLKGTFVRVLKESAASIKEAVQALQSRSSTEETRRLQAANARLQVEVRELRQDIVELRREMLQARAAVPAARPPERSSQGRAGTPGLAVDDATRERMQQIGGLSGELVEAMEKPLPPQPHTRPPTAADRRKPTAPKASVVVNLTPEPQPGPSGMPAVLDKTKSLPSATLQGKKRARDTTGRNMVAQGRRPAAAKSGENRPQTAKVQPGVSWVEVAKRGRKSRPAVTPAPSQGTQSRAGAARQRKPAEVGREKVGLPRLRAPKSAAIVLTIQPKGAEEGLTYVKALTVAKQRVDLASLGITSALGFRKAAERRPWPKG